MRRWLTRSSGPPVWPPQATHSGRPSGGLPRRSGLRRRWGGPILGLFVVYHLLHLTVGTVHPSAVGFDPADVYNNVVIGFQVWWTSAIYLAAVIFLGLHLYHGAWSMFQSIGANHPKWNIWRRAFAAFFAVAVTLGNISIPVAVLIGAVRPV